SNIKNKEKKIKHEPSLENLPNKHTRVIIDFESGERMFFNDIRKFGWIKIVKNPNSKIQISKKYQISNSKYNIPTLQSITNRLGPDPLNELTIQHFRQILKQSRQPIKLLLMDQSKIAGVGNIYANDALFLSRIHPKTPANKLLDGQMVKLFESLLKVLQEGLRWKGASKTNFVDVFGQKGSMQEHFYVYGGEGEKCPNQCGGKIEKMNLGGRGTFYCRKCQSLK
ncbi:hypothetical protein HY338_03145, partial [Candidatus Gottesmanbacteria bacterium]|nr:hypothetical protein [Candidatus Gottesmanbacteria bacterium]